MGKSSHWPQPALDQVSCKLGKTDSHATVGWLPADMGVRTAHASSKACPMPTYKVSCLSALYRLQAGQSSICGKGLMQMQGHWIFTESWPELTLAAMAGTVACLQSEFLWPHLCHLPACQTPSIAGREGCPSYAGQC